MTKIFFWTWQGLRPCWLWVDIQVCKPLMLVYVARHWILGSSHSALLGRATFLLTEDLVQPTVSWLNFHQLQNLHRYTQLRLQVRNGLGLKYRVLCSRVWPHLVQYTNLHNLQCHIQLTPQVRNGLGLKYRVLCSRHWPHLGQLTNYITLVIILLCHD